MCSLYKSSGQNDITRTLEDCRGSVDIVPETQPDTKSGDASFQLPELPDYQK
jgi:hypothetical protein